MKRLGPWLAAVGFVASCGAPELATTTLKVMAPLAASDIRSYHIYIVPTKDNQGQPVSCPAFLANTVPADAVPILADGLYPLDASVPDSFSRELVDVPPGSDRLVWVEGYDQAFGEGVVVARGCSPVVVKPKQTATVKVCLYAVPLPADPAPCQ